jgi:hypothetical protein
MFCAHLLFHTVVESRLSQEDPSGNPAEDCMNTLIAILRDTQENSKDELAPTRSVSLQFVFFIFTQSKFLLFYLVF